MKAPIASRIVSNTPFEKNVLTASDDSPDERSARSTRSRQALRTPSQISGSSHDAQHLSINISRSNIKKPDRPPVKNGVETHVVDIEFGTSKEKKAHAPVTFEVKEKSGTISGVITQEAPPEKAPK